MKSKYFQSLNDEWKKYCVETDSDCLPLIEIDHKTIWYGLPVTKGALKEKNGRIILSPCFIAVRLKGKHSIEIIESLTDLHNIQQDGTVTPLLVKTSQDVKQTKTGISSYIETHASCKTCHHKVVLAKNKKGTTFVRCPSCNGVDYLDIHMVNEYIEEYGITCPTHRCRIKAKIGQFGPYVLCEHGHFLKITDI